MSSSDSDHLSIFIILSGELWKTKINPNIKINKLISLAVSHFHGSSVHSSSKSVSRKLVHVRTRAILSGERTIMEEDLKDRDEVLLVESCTPPKKAPPDLRGPTLSEIIEATKNLEMRNTTRPRHETLQADELDFSERFSKDSPCIFISLIETGARLLTFAPDGMEVFNIVKKEMLSKREPDSNSPCVKQLMDMGFPEKIVLKALTAKKMNVAEATEWLLEHGSSSHESNQEEEPSSSQSQHSTVFEAFQHLIQTALRNRNANFKINVKHVQNLTQMGYEEKDIENALREADNNLRTAISLLKGNKLSSIPMRSKGLDRNGSMFKALMSSELIQLNIKKPKFLLALLSILEDPQSLTLWLKDRDTSCILNNLILLHNTESSGGQRIF